MEIDSAATDSAHFDFGTLQKKIMYEEKNISFIFFVWYQYYKLIKFYCLSDSI